MPDFDEVFQVATGCKPLPCQRRFAEAGDLPQIVDAPTGCGKTVAVVLGWLWRGQWESLKVHEASDDHVSGPRGDKANLGEIDIFDPESGVIGR